MNERIKLFASMVPFDPVGYTWIYLKSTEADELVAMNNIAITEDRTEHFWAYPVEELTLPFERMAVVIEDGEAWEMQGNVFTVERGICEDLQELGVTTRLWEPLQKTPVFSMEKVNSRADEVHVRFSEHKLKTELRNFTPEQVTEALNENMLAANYTVGALLMLGVKETSVSYKHAYTCIGDATKNAKRIRKGKKPFFEWTSIEIKDTRVINAFASEHKGGTHASPKPHERMGHWRTYKTGKRVFVRSSIVNKHKMPEEGYIFHDYIKGEAHEISR